jgi:hypothetical protein
MPVCSQELYKDEILAALAERANVAQFVSFDTGLRQRFARVRGFPPNHNFDSVQSAVESLLRSSPEGKVNIRSFKPDDGRGREFIELQTDPQLIVGVLSRLAGNGSLTIVNESIDVNDGGVSGVMMGGIIEFSPGETPRCVEGAEIAALPSDIALKLLNNVYRFQPELSFGPSMRVEFSIHPFPRGYAESNTIIWEAEDVGSTVLEAQLVWPNRFSRLVGDKVFGLLLADAFGLPVPAADVISRYLPPYRFGTRTQSGMKWLRTCPSRRIPGRFTTVRGWRDPFRIMLEDEPDPKHPVISSIIVQDEVSSEFSGALLTSANGRPIIEGVAGFGDKFMLGNAGPVSLPRGLRKPLEELHQRMRKLVGPLRIEWASDGQEIWILQLQQQPGQSRGNVIYPGEPRVFYSFDSSQGLERLRELVSEVKDKNIGITLIGNVGMTSHLADVLRDAQIPSRRQLPDASP